jgi:hypothetical protein
MANEISNATSASARVCINAIANNADLDGMVIIPGIRMWMDFMYGAILAVITPEGAFLGDGKVTLRCYIEGKKLHPVKCTCSVAQLAQKERQLALVPRLDRTPGQTIIKHWGQKQRVPMGYASYAFVSGNLSWVKENFLPGKGSAGTPQKYLRAEAASKKSAARPSALQRRLLTIPSKYQINEIARRGPLLVQSMCGDAGAPIQLQSARTRNSGNPATAPNSAPLLVPWFIDSMREAYVICWGGSHDCDLSGATDKDPAHGSML